jgi:hypothetical protein
VGWGAFRRLTPTTDHIVRLTMDQEPHAVGREAGRPTLRMFMVDSTIATCRGKENIRQVLAALDIEGLRPRTEEKGAA